MVFFQCCGSEISSFSHVVEAKYLRETLKLDSVAGAGQEILQEVLISIRINIYEIRQFLCCTSQFISSHCSVKV
jgi:hypothetical protein